MKYYDISILILNAFTLPKMEKFDLNEAAPFPVRDRIKLIKPDERDYNRLVGRRNLYTKVSRSSKRSVC